MTSAGQRGNVIIQALQYRQRSTFYPSGIAAILVRGAYRRRVRTAQTSMQYVCLLGSVHRHQHDSGGDEFRLTVVLSEARSRCAVVAAACRGGRGVTWGAHFDPCV